MRTRFRDCSVREEQPTAFPTFRVCDVGYRGGLMRENDVRQPWHTPVLRSLEANRTSQSDQVFTTDDSSNDDPVLVDETEPDALGNDPADAS
jgi:hypothetical protein